MARNFNDMTKEKLISLINSEAELAQLSSVELSEVRRMAKSAGILNGLIEDNLAIAINNRTYKDIVESKDYTPEEKKLALDARDEYNTEIRVKHNSRNYNAEEIMKRAHLEDGIYHFSSITVGEMNFLIQSGVFTQNQVRVDKEYKVGQEKDQSLAQILQAVKQAAEKKEAISKPVELKNVISEKAEESAEIRVNEGYDKPEIKNELKPQATKVAASIPSMPTELQKSYDFWNKFNENTPKTGIKYNIENIEDKHLLVEAKKGEKTIFKGIDHGSKGFDILVRDKDAEPYEMFDILVKKAKASNPKTVIRIKDNVTDPILRNKILIACAKNNMIPVGNLPKGFDFEALKAMVKELRSTEEINDLANTLYVDNSEFSLGLSEPKKKEPTQVLTNVVDNTQEEEKKKDDKDKPVVLAIPVPENKTSAGNGGSINSNNGNVGGNGGNGTNPKTPNNQPTTPYTPVAPKTSLKEEGFWKKTWNKSKKWILGGLLVAASFFGIKSCQQQQQMDNDKDRIENLTHKNDSLQNVIDLKDKIIADQQIALDDCGKEKKPAKVFKKKKVVPPVVVKKPEPVKQEPVKTEPIKTEPVKVEPVKKEPVKVEPVKKEPVKVEPAKKDPVIVPKKQEPVIQEPQPSKLKPINLDIQHGEDNDFANSNMGSGTSNGSISLKKQRTGVTSSDNTYAAATRSGNSGSINLGNQHGTDDDLSKKGKTADFMEFYRLMNGNEK